RPANWTPPGRKNSSASSTQLVALRPSLVMKDQTLAPSVFRRPLATLQVPDWAVQPITGGRPGSEGMLKLSLTTWAESEPIKTKGTRRKRIGCMAIGDERWSGREV